MRNNRIQLKEQITLVVLAAFLLGCYATTHRGPQTLKPGGFSASGGYLRFTDAEDSGDDPGELVQVEGRVGVARGIDIGYMRTFEISEGVEAGEGIDTHWFDAKFQLSNRDNVLSKPTLALGYGFGKLVNEDDFWVNSLYLTLGSYHEKGAIFYSFRYETFSDEIKLLPSWVWEEPFDEIRKAHIIGLELQLIPNLYPVVEIGRFYDDGFGDGLNVITIGVNYYAP